MVPKWSRPGIQTGVQLTQPSYGTLRNKNVVGKLAHNYSTSKFLISRESLQWALPPRTDGFRVSFSLGNNPGENLRTRSHLDLFSPVLETRIFSVQFLPFRRVNIQSIPNQSTTRRTDNLINIDGRRSDHQHPKININQQTEMSKQSFGFFLRIGT